MNKDIYLIGDVHGLFKPYLDIVNNLDSTSVQLGDFGIGFIHSRTNYVRNPNSGTPRLTNCLVPKGHYFIRGNHDNPEVCKRNKAYLGDYGLFENRVFFISGAMSLDKYWRTPNIDWWHEEELRYSELEQAIGMFKTYKPDIVISHDCPMEYSIKKYEKTAVPSVTSLAFNEMLKIHRPKYWYFGHHHQSIRDEIDGTKYIGLDELEVIKI